jgi:hypothetical protein
MRRYQVAIDYSARTMTFALPGTLRPSGAAVPCQVNDATGLISVEVSVGGNKYRAAVDSGSAYTWFSKRTVENWIGKHPEWQRGTGAVGESNMQMTALWDYVLLSLPRPIQSPRLVEFLGRHLPADREADGTLMRLPEIWIGSIRLQRVGALGVADIIEWYSKKTPALLKVG